jgi:hypothetical protein
MVCMKAQRDDIIVNKKNDSRKLRINWYLLEIALDHLMLYLRLMILAGN